MPAHKKEKCDLLKRRTVTMTDREWIALTALAASHDKTICQLVREILSRELAAKKKS